MGNAIEATWWISVSMLCTVFTTGMFLMILDLASTKWKALDCLKIIRIWWGLEAVFSASIATAAFGMSSIWLLVVALLALAVSVWRIRTIGRKINTL